MEKKTSEPSKKSVIAVSIVTSFITTFMGSALNLSIPGMERELQGSAAQVGWVITLYMLTCAALTVPFGKLADKGKKTRILRIGLLIFTAASALGIFSYNMAMVLICRTAQGVGASMIFSTNIALLVGTVDKGQRGKVLGYAACANYAGLSAGPALGGFLNYNLGWRSIFAAAAIICGIAFFISLKKIPEKTGTEKTEDNGSDIAGTMLYIVSIVSVMYGASELSSSFAGPALLVAGMACFWLFVKREKSAQAPMIDINMFSQNSAYTCANLATMINYGANFGLTYLLSIYLQVARGMDSQKAGLIMVIAPAVMSVLSPAMGKLSDRYSPQIMSSTGVVICGAAILIFTLMPEDARLWQIMAALAFSGLGLALFVTPNTNAVLSSVANDGHGIASSILATMRSAGHTMSMAVITVIVGIYMGQGSLEGADPQIVMKIVRLSLFIFAVLCIPGFFMALRRKP